MHYKCEKNKIVRANKLPDAKKIQLPRIQLIGQFVLFGHRTKLFVDHQYYTLLLCLGTPHFETESNGYGGDNENEIQSQRMTFYKQVLHFILSCRNCLSSSSIRLNICFSQLSFPLQ